MSGPMTSTSWTHSYSKQSIWMVHVHKDKTDSIHLKGCVNEFVSLNSHRSNKIAMF